MGTDDLSREIESLREANRTDLASIDAKNEKAAEAVKAGQWETATKIALEVIAAQHLVIRRQDREIALHA